MQNHLSNALFYIVCTFVCIGADDVPPLIVYTGMIPDHAPLEVALPGPLPVLQKLQFYDTRGIRIQTDEQRRGGSFSGGGVELKLQALGITAYNVDNRRLSLNASGANAGSLADIAVLWYASEKAGESWSLLLRPMKIAAITAKVDKDNIITEIPDSPLVASAMKLCITNTLKSTLHYSATFDIYADTKVMPSSTSTSRWQIVCSPTEDDLDRVLQALVNPTAISERPTTLGGKSRREQLYDMIRKALANGTGGSSKSSGSFSSGLYSLRSDVRRALNAMRLNHTDRFGHLKPIATKTQSPLILSALARDLEALPDGSPMIATKVLDSRTARLLTSTDVEELSSSSSFRTLSQTLGISTTSSASTGSSDENEFNLLVKVFSVSETFTQSKQGPTGASDADMAMALQQLETEFRQDLQLFADGKRAPNVSLSKPLSKATENDDSQDDGRVIGFGRPRSVQGSRQEVVEQENRRFMDSAKKDKAEVENLRRSLKSSLATYSKADFFTYVVFNEKIYTRSIQGGASGLQRLLGASRSYARVANLLNETVKTDLPTALGIILKGFAMAQKSPTASTNIKATYSACLQELKRIALRRILILKTPDLSNQIDMLDREYSPILFFDRLFKSTLVDLLDVSLLEKIAADPAISSLNNSSTNPSPAGTSLPPPQKSPISTEDQLLPTSIDICVGNSQKVLISIDRVKPPKTGGP